MANALDALDIAVRIREVGDTDWKTLVCEIDSQSDLTNDTTETDTKCGTFTGVKVAKGNFSGNAMYNVQPTNEEVSYNDVYNWQQNRTALEFLMLNEAFTAEDGTPIAEGESFHQYCTGKFVNSSFQGAVGDVGKFSWSFKPQGTINTSGTSS